MSSPLASIVIGVILFAIGVLFLLSGKFEPIAYLICVLVGAFLVGLGLWNMKPEKEK